MKNKKILLGGLLAVGGLLVAATCLYRSFSPAQFLLYGNVDIRTVTVSFRVGGRVATLLVDEGDRVKEGSPIATLDKEPFEIALGSARANEASQLANYTLMQAGYRIEEIEQARSALKEREAELVYAKASHDRQSSLFKIKAVSKDDLDMSRRQLDQAQAAYRTAQQKVVQYETGNRLEEIEAAKAAYEKARTEVFKAELDVKDTFLTAPSNGTILTRAVEKGAMVAEGSPVFTLSLTSPVWVRAYIDEMNLDKAVPGATVYIYTDVRSDRPYTGTIGFVSPTAEFTPKTVQTPELRTALVYRLRIIVSDPDDSLRQGMPVTIAFSL